MKMKTFLIFPDSKLLNKPSKPGFSAKVELPDFDKNPYF